MYHFRQIFSRKELELNIEIIVENEHVAWMSLVKMFSHTFGIDLRTIHLQAKLTLLYN